MQCDIRRKGKGDGRLLANVVIEPLECRLPRHIANQARTNKRAESRDRFANAREQRRRHIELRAAGEPIDAVV